MTMAARRAIQVLATVGLFAGLVAARVVVETFPAAKAVNAIADLVLEKAPAEGGSAERPEVAREEEPAGVVTPVPEGALAGAPAASPGALRRVPSHLGRGLPRASVQLIRMPSVPS